LLSPDFVGRVYPGVGAHEIHASSIASFAYAINDPNPAYLDVTVARALGYSDVIAPPTYLVSIALSESQRALTDPAFGLDWSRVVHGDQRFKFNRPVVAGDVLMCETVIEAIKSVAGNDFVTTRADFFDDQRTLVASAWSMLVVRGPDS
jgi:acyl dehydratase